MLSADPLHRRPPLLSHLVPTIECVAIESTLILRTDPPGVTWLDAEHAGLLRRLVVVFDALRTRCGLGPCTIEIVLSDDLGSAVRGLQGQLVGVEALDDYSVERIGGVVAGKTMYRDAAHEDCIVVLDAGLFRSAFPAARATAAQVSAHEFAHGLVGQLRAAGGPPMPSTCLPWETCRWLARYGFEEYLADTIAEVFLGTYGTVTLPDGSSRPLTGSDSTSCREEFVVAAAQTLDAIATTIHDYRIGRIDLERMWSGVQADTSSLLVALAHAQSEHDHAIDDGHSVAASSGAPMASMWEAVRQSFCLDIFDGAEQFVVSEQEAIRRGGEAIVEFWRAVGLTFTPHGDAFFISVAAPEDAWPLGLAEGVSPT